MVLLLGTGAACKPTRPHRLHNPRTHALTRPPAELRVLEQLPPSVTVVGIGKGQVRRVQRVQCAQPHHSRTTPRSRRVHIQDLAVTPEQLASVEVLLSCGVGKAAAKKEDVQVRGVHVCALGGSVATACDARPLSACAQALWPSLKSLKWVHSASAGLEGLLFPELVSAPVDVTNAKVRAADG